MQRYHLLMAVQWMAQTAKQTRIVLILLLSIQPIRLALVRVYLQPRFIKTVFMRSIKMAY